MAVDWMAFALFLIILLLAFAIIKKIIRTALSLAFLAFLLLLFIVLLLARLNLISLQFF